MSSSLSIWRQQFLEPLRDVEHLEHSLLLLELDRQVRGDRVGQPAGFVDAVERGQDLRRDLLVELHVLVELREHRAAHRLGLRRVVGRRLSIGVRSQTKCVAGVDDAGDPRTLGALDQHLHGAVGSFSICRMFDMQPMLVDIVSRRIVLGSRSSGRPA